MTITVTKIVLFCIGFLIAGVLFGVVIMSLVIVSQKSDLLAELAREHEKVGKLVEIIEEICSDVRERHGGDDVCGLCEYDGPEWMECPGYETDECFVLKKEFRDEYMGE